MSADQAHVGQRVIRGGTGPLTGKVGTITFLHADEPLASVHYDGAPRMLWEGYVPLLELDPIGGEE